MRADFTVIGHDRSGAAWQSVMRNSRRAATEVGVSGRMVERTTGRMQSSLGRMMRFMGQQLSGTVRSFFYGLRMGVVGAGVAVSAFVATSLKSFRDFDKKLRETTSLIAGSGAGGLKNSFKEAQKAYKDFYSFLLRTAPQMRRTPQDLAGGLYELVQAGLRPTAAKQLLRPAAMGATAGGSEVAPSARVMVQIMNALKMGTTKKGAGGQAQKVMDQIFQAINLGVGVDFPTLSTGIGKFIGSAGVAFKGGRGKAGDNTLKQLMATYIFSTQQGARTQDVGVGIQDVIKTIANPSAKGKAFAKQIGLGGLGSQFLEQHGFVGSLTTIIQKMKDAGYTGARLNDAIGKLFGDVRGRRIVSYATNLDMVKAAMDAMGQSTGATKRAFDEQGKSLDASIQTFKAYWETLKIGLGSSIQPYVRKGADVITNLLTSTGATGRGQDLLNNEAGWSASHRARYRKSLSPQDQVLEGRARSFNQAGLGGKIKQLGSQALDSLQAWWRNPATQARFNSAMHAVINRSFTMAGQAIRSMPSIYTFGRKIAAEILRGAVDGLKGSVSGVLGSVSGGLLGGGGGGGGSLLPGPQNGYQAAAGGLLGMMAIRGTRGRGALMGGAGLMAGGMMAGLPAPLAALLGVAGTGASMISNRRSKAGAAGTEGTDIMKMTASTVYVTGTNVYNRGGGGGAGGVPSYAATQGPRPLKPGYTSTPKGYRNPTGQYVNISEALGAHPVAGGGGGGGGGLLGQFDSMILSEKETKNVESRLDRIKNKYTNVKKTMASTRVGRVAGSKGGRLGALGAVGAGASMLGAGGGDMQTLLLQGLLGGVGAASFMLGPEVGIPAMLGAGALSAYLGRGNGPRDPGKGVMDVINTAQGYHKKGGNIVVGSGGKFGKGIGDMNMFNILSPSTAQIKDKNRVKLYGLELDAAMKTPWDQEGKMAAHIENALKWAGSSEAGMGGAQAVYQGWMDWSIGREAYMKSLEATGSTALSGRTADQKRIGAGFHGKGTPKAFTSVFGTGTYDPRGGTGRPAPGHQDAVGRIVNMGKKGKRKGIPAIWDAGLDLMNAPAVGKALKKAGSDPIAGTGDSFMTGLDLGMNEAKRQAKPKLTSLMEAYTTNAIALAGGGSTSGPSAGPPPSPGTTSGFNNARDISSRGLSGAEDSAFGPAMMTAGGAMADKVSETIATSVAKKQMTGPVGNAQKGLRWLYQQVGKPYIWGGGHPPGLNLPGYDCSGLASSALMAMGSSLAGTTYSMIGNTAPGAGLVQLGFNPATNPHHMGIRVMGKWFEAAHTGAPIRGPNDARSSWPYVGTPKFHKGGVFRSNMTQGDEGPAILRDGELVVRPTTDGGLQAVPMNGGGLQVNGPLIGVAHVRHDGDIHRIAQELVDLLEKKKQNSGHTT